MRIEHSAPLEVPVCRVYRVFVWVCVMCESMSTRVHVGAHACHPPHSQIQGRLSAVQSTECRPSTPRAHATSTPNVPLMEVRRTSVAFRGFLWSGPQDKGWRQSSLRTSIRCVLRLVGTAGSALHQEPRDPAAPPIIPWEDTAHPVHVDTRWFHWLRRIVGPQCHDGTAWHTWPWIRWPTIALCIHWTRESCKTLTFSRKKAVRAMVAQRVVLIRAHVGHGRGPEQCNVLGKVACAAKQAGKRFEPASAQSTSSFTDTNLKCTTSPKQHPAPLGCHSQK